MKGLHIFSIIVLATVFGFLYISLSNKARYFNESLIRDGALVVSQKQRLSSLQHSLTDALAERASSKHMVKIPETVTVNTAEVSYKTYKEVQLASNKR